MCFPFLAGAYQGTWADGESSLKKNLKIPKEKIRVRRHWKPYNYFFFHAKIIFSSAKIIIDFVLDYPSTIMLVSYSRTKVGRLTTSTCTSGGGAPQSSRRSMCSISSVATSPWWAKNCNSPSLQHVWREVCASSWPRSWLCAYLLRSRSSSLHYYFWSCSASLRTTFTSPISI